MVLHLSGIFNTSLENGLSSTRIVTAVRLVIVPYVFWGDASSRFLVSSEELLHLVHGSCVVCPDRQLRVALQKALIKSGPGRLSINRVVLPKESRYALTNRQRSLVVIGNPHSPSKTSLSMIISSSVDNSVGLPKVSLTFSLILPCRVARET